MGLLAEAKRLQKAQQIATLKEATLKHISYIRNSMKMLNSLRDELDADDDFTSDEVSEEIGRASCRERV